MIKLLLTALLASLLFSCSSSSTAGGGDSVNVPEGGKPEVENVDINDTTQRPFSVNDNTVKINPNNTINDEFGNGLLPNEFVNGERINHNFKPAYFSYDSASIHQQEVAKLKMLAGFLESNPNLFLIIEGHCDERGSDEYNRALSERRALAVKGFLEKAAPSINSRINTIGYGEEKLADTGKTVDAHARNRRAEFVIISKR